MAEELACHVIIEDALASLELDSRNRTEASIALAELYEYAFEDMDFQALYKLGYENEKTDIDGDVVLGATDLRFEQWFVPFGSGANRGVPHPFLNE